MDQKTNEILAEVWDPFLDNLLKKEEDADDYCARMEETEQAFQRDNIEW